MNACKIVCSSVFSLQVTRRKQKWSPFLLGNCRSGPENLCSDGFGTCISQTKGSSRSYACVFGAISRDTEVRFSLANQSVEMKESSCEIDKDITSDIILNQPGIEGQELLLESLSTPIKSVEELLGKPDDVRGLMKMERISEINNEGNGFSSIQLEGGAIRKHWFPYLDLFKSGNMSLSSGEVLEALDPHILEIRKERMREVVKNRSYSICLVVEGLTDFGNVSAAFRSADALGFQSVHVVSCDSSKRYRKNRHVSMGAEKWLDIELWNSTEECFKVLKSHGYRVATTHVGIDTVSIYDMDWTFPTAVVVGNERRGISDEALELSDLHCSIPMKGMVDSFNVSVAAGILMHHAVCDRITRMGCHGDLTHEERQILLAEFFLRHSKSSISIAHEHARRKLYKPMPKL